MFTLVGTQHLKGKSKAGNDYDFMVLHCLCGDPYVSGQKCITLKASAEAFQNSGILLGEEFRCSYLKDNYGYKVLEFL